jgi:hypothetical protein
MIRTSANTGRLIILQLPVPVAIRSLRAQQMLTLSFKEEAAAAAAAVLVPRAEPVLEVVVVVQDST